MSSTPCSLHRTTGCPSLLRCPLLMSPAPLLRQIWLLACPRTIGDKAGDVVEVEAAGATATTTLVVAVVQTPAMLPLCQLCSKRGHAVHAHYHRFDQAFQPTASTTSNTTHTTEGNNDSLWFPDSGASNHFTGDLSNLQDRTSYTGADQVYLGNGQGAPIALPHYP